MNSKYIHTINNIPAVFDGEQICYSRNIKYVDAIICFFEVRDAYAKEMCSSLGEIRKQQKMSSKWRKEKGFDDIGDNYGYFIIKIPSNQEEQKDE
jgi:hypothetical protein